MVRARGARPRRQRACSTSASTSSSARSIGAKLLLLITDFHTFTANPRELLTLARSGGVFYGGLILAVGVALWYIRRIGLPLWTTCDVFAPGIALGHVVGRFGCFFAGCCYGKPTTLPWGDHVHRSVRRGQRRHAARRPAASDAAVRGRRRASDPAACCSLTERKGRPFAGRTFWLYMLLYADLALHHRVLPRRRARHGRHVLDLAVHLDRCWRRWRSPCSCISRAPDAAGAEDARARPA